MHNAGAAKTLTLEVEAKSDANVVHCRGRLVAEVAGGFYARVQPLVREHKCVVLDLTELTHMDSMGLGALVRLYVSAKAAGSQIQLINLGKQVRELLGLTNMLGVFADMCEHGVIVKY